ncbi:MAG: hypothetical protein AAB870_01380, partial [Patescibacteria group bacterium]
MPNFISNLVAKKNKKIGVFRKMHLAVIMIAVMVTITVLSSFHASLYKKVEISSADITANNPLPERIIGNNKVEGFSLIEQGFKDVNGKFFVADRSNNRVLIYNTAPTSVTSLPDVVLGQVSFVFNSDTSLTAITARTMSAPTAVYSNGTKLFVVDSARNRVLIWNTIPTSNFDDADVVLGQPDDGNAFDSGTANNGGISASTLSFGSGGGGVWVNGTKLFVADSGNNRVLIWNTIPTASGTAANNVIGQDNFTTGTANGVTVKLGCDGATPIDACGLSFPAFVSSDGTKLYISDAANHRVLIYNSIPTADTPLADLELGQPDDGTPFNSGGSVAPVSGATVGTRVNMFSDGTTLYVTDGINNRILTFNTFPTTNNQTASAVVGQYTDSATTLVDGSFMDGSSVGGFLDSSGRVYMYSVVSDRRVLMYDSIPTSDRNAADRIVGHSDAFTKNPNATFSSSKLNFTSDPAFPFAGVASDGTRLLVGDFSAHRVLMWNTAPTSTGQAADVVFGQPDFTTGTADNGGVDASSLNKPRNMSISGGKIAIAESLKHRVKIYNSIPSGNNADAD